MKLMMSIEISTLLSAIAASCLLYPQPPLAIARPLGSYLRGRIERVLDACIEYQKRKRGGFYKLINPNDWCPACGHKNGVIVYNPEIQRVVHTCAVCTAPWPELPRVPANAWDFLGRDLKAAGERAQDVRETFIRANAPLLRKPDAVGKVEA